MTLAVVTGYLLAWLLSMLSESRALPAVARPWRQPAAALLLHALATAQIYVLLLAVTGRIGFSVAMSIALAALVVFVSNAKVAALQEPLVFSDLFLIRQLIRYPRLYLPFVGRGSWWRSAGVLLVVLAGFGLDHAQPAPFRLHALIALLLVSAAMWLTAQGLQLQLNAASDQARTGFFASFYAGLLKGLRPATAQRLAHALRQGPFAPSDDLPASPRQSMAPDVIVIQSESFFDARRLGPEVHPQLLRHFDRARREAVAWGDLQVPAFGANTMRTEFAVLSGLPLEQQGYACYYPYAFVRRHAPSLAGHYRALGYRTCFIHPYHADFFGRDQVMPAMQFEGFLDLRAFTADDRQGPYTSDRAVAREIIRQLESAGAEDRPAFVMAVTMENHGPLHLEQVSLNESSRYHAFGEGGRLDDLTAYLRHLANADAMIGDLLEYLRRRSRPSVVCFYGDHVPALPDLFARLGRPQSETDYFIWHSARSTGSEPRKLNAHELGRWLIQAADS